MNTSIYLYLHWPAVPSLAAFMNCIFYVSNNLKFNIPTFWCCYMDIDSLWPTIRFLLKFIYSEKATKFCELTYFWLQYIRSKVRGRFRKILWPSQNIWTFNVLYRLSFLLRQFSKLIPILPKWSQRNAIMGLFLIKYVQRKGILFKVNIFWEGHKILRNLPLTFDRSTYNQK